MLRIYAAPLNFPLPITMNRVHSAFALTALMFIAGFGGASLKPAIKASDKVPVIEIEKMVPAQFGEWRQEQLPVSQVVNPQTKELLDKLYSQILSRTYINKSGDRIMLSLAYGNDQRDELQAHKPEICYPAQGFTLHANDPGALLTDYGDIPVRRLSTSLGSRQEPVTYWFTIGDSVIENKMVKRLVELRYGLTGLIPDGLLFRVSSIDADRDHAYQVQDQFVKQLLRSVNPDDRLRLSGLNLR